MEYIIRLATPDDAKDVHDIYGTYVNEEHVTFTIDNPDIEDYCNKTIHTMEMYPFYIAEDKNGKVLGYIYGSPLRPHDAYKWNVESTIVLAPDAPRRKGIASGLYKKFIETLSLQGFKYVFGVIVDSNEASIKLHESLGFENAGHFLNVGYKMGKWRGIVWMQKQIGEINKEPHNPIPFSQLTKQREV